MQTRRHGRVDPVCASMNSTQPFTWVDRWLNPVENPGLANAEHYRSWTSNQYIENQRMIYKFESKEKEPLTIQKKRQYLAFRLNWTPLLYREKQARSYDPKIECVSACDSDQQAHRQSNDQLGTHTVVVEKEREEVTLFICTWTRLLARVWRFLYCYQRYLRFYLG